MLCAGGEAGQKVETLFKHTADLEEQMAKTSATLLQVYLHSLHA